jgi:hypothetical protein
MATVDSSKTIKQLDREIVVCPRAFWRHKVENTVEDVVFVQVMNAMAPPARLAGTIGTHFRIELGLSAWTYNYDS